MRENLLKSSLFKTLDACSFVLHVYRLTVVGLAANDEGGDGGPTTDFEST